jgi:hypothetical protein
MRVSLWPFGAPEIGKKISNASSGERMAPFKFFAVYKLNLSKTNEKEKRRKSELKEEKDDEKGELRHIYFYMWQKMESREMHTAGREGSFGGPGNV